MTHDRGAVVWCRDPFKTDPDAGRPWVVVNNGSHPFDDEQYITLALSTSGHDGAIPLSDEDWTDGGTPRRSYILPWSTHSPKERDVEFRQGYLTTDVVDAALEELFSYVDGE